MDKATREVRRKQWENIIEQCHARPKGESIKHWLNERGLSDKTYYHWQRKLRQEAYDQMKQTTLPAVDQETDVTFAELPAPQDPGPEATDPVSFHADAVIRTGQCTIAVSNTASKQLLKKIFEVTRSC